MSEITLRPQRFWEDVQEGDAIEGFEITLNWTTMVEQVAGSQDWNLVHHDPDFAKASGHKGIFYNTGFTHAALARTLTDWAGPYGWLRHLDFQMRRMNMNGDTMRTAGRVVRTYEEDGQHLVEIELWIENDREGVTTPANAVLLLHSRKDEGNLKALV